MSTAPVILPDTYDAQPALTPFQRDSDTFFAPSKTFADIRRNRVLQLVFLAFSALLLWVGFNFILGGSSTYPQMFAVSAFASLPGMIRALLGVVMLYAGDTDTFNMQDPVGTNPGYYLSGTAAPWLHSFLGSFDIVTLWVLFLSALGGAIVARVKPATGYALVFGVWFVYVLAKTGFAAAFS